MKQNLSNEKKQPRNVELNILQREMKTWLGQLILYLRYFIIEFLRIIKLIISIGWATFMGDLMVSVCVDSLSIKML